MDNEEDPVIWRGPVIAGVVKPVSYTHLKKPEEKTSPVKEILSWVLTIAFAIVAAILIKNYVIINANIPSSLFNACSVSSIKSPSRFFNRSIILLLVKPRRTA